MQVSKTVYIGYNSQKHKHEIQGTSTPKRHNKPLKPLRTTGKCLIFLRQRPGVRRAGLCFWNHLFLGTVGRLALMFMAIRQTPKDSGTGCLVTAVFALSTSDTRPTVLTISLESCRYTTIYTHDPDLLFCQWYAKSLFGSLHFNVKLPYLWT